MAIRFYGFSTRSKIAILALGAIAVAVGGVLLVLGLTLLVGLAALGLAVALGTAVYRKLTGRSVFRRNKIARHQMDRTLEVFPAESNTGVSEQLQSEHKAPRLPSDTRHSDIGS